VHGLGPLYGVRPEASTYTFARDGLGSVRAEVSSSGSASKSFRYAAYGAITQSTGGSSSLLGFAGEFADPSGLVYLRARWYDPVTGRFATSDPQGGDTARPPSLNAYSYALTAPTRFVDPSGNTPLLLLALVNPVTRGALIGAVSYSVGWLAARVIEQEPISDFDFRGLALATAAGAVTGGFGARAATGGRVLLGAGVSGAVEETTQLLENKFSPEQLIASTTFGGFAGLFPRGNALPCAYWLQRAIADGQTAGSGHHPPPVHVARISCALADGGPSTRRGQVTQTWLLAFIGVGSFLAFVYFTCDLAVLLRGPESVTPTILKLARAGDRRIGKGSLPDIAVTAGAAMFFVVVPAAWLAVRRSDADIVGQLFLLGGLIAAASWAVALPLLIRRGAGQQQ
jgi:RHS repeat-associated protein